MKNKIKNTEKEASSRLFRATIGFDFLFARDADKTKHIFCLELNGENSYIPVNEIEGWNVDKATRERVQTRMIYNPERIRRSQYAKSLGSDISLEIRKKARARAKAVYVFENAIRNEPYIKNLVNSKKAHQSFIPSQYRPRAYVHGESPLSSTGFWICKPSSGQRGKGVHILTNDMFAKKFIGTKLEKTHLAQKFITALGADKAPESMKNNPAVLRLVMDIEYFRDDTIKELFVWANQSISPYSMKDSKSDHSLEEVCVITVAERNSKIVMASENEFQMAHKAGIKIIRNIAMHKKVIEESKVSQSLF